MKNATCLRLWAIGTAALVVAVASMAPPAAAQTSEPGRGGCSLQGSWLGGGEEQAGDTFFGIFSRGATDVEGPLVLEWIVQEPMFGAMTLTQAVGQWRKAHGRDFEYTFLFYGLDVNGELVYAIRNSGTTTIQDCDSAEFEYVSEVFFIGLETPSDVLNGEPDFCLAGQGRATRLPLIQAECP